MFKVGDKVRIIKFPSKSCIGMICTVIEDADGSDYCCRVKNPLTHWNCLMLPGEIESIAKVGEQLLLFEL